MMLADGEPMPRRAFEALAEARAAEGWEIPTVADAIAHVIDYGRHAPAVVEGFHVPLQGLRGMWLREAKESHDGFFWSASLYDGGISYVPAPLGRGGFLIRR